MAHPAGRLKPAVLLAPDTASDATATASTPSLGIPPVPPASAGSSASFLRRLAVLCALILLTACGQPVKPRIGAEQALQLRDPWTFRVLKVHDALRVKDPTPGATHLLDVEITAPSELAGKRCALPYDEWAMGAAPPKAGSVHTLAPRAWIAGNPRSRGRPIEGFDGTRPMDRR